MVSEPKKKVWAVGNLEPMANDPKTFPEADYLASGTSKPTRSLRTWCLAILGIVFLTLLGLLIIYGIATRFDYLRHH
ncbi:MAG: hypothetical protein ABIP39_05760 [Polyangiaceae bacterium]